MLNIRAICLAVAIAAATIPATTVASFATPVAAVQSSCGDGYYRNSAGRCVQRPTRTPNNRPPAGATARCRDGTYSFSQSRRGTCSHHGGVATWL